MRQLLEIFGGEGVDDGNRKKRCTHHLDCVWGHDEAVCCRKTRNFTRFFRCGWRRCRPLLPYGVFGQLALQGAAVHLEGAGGG